MPWTATVLCLLILILSAGCGWAEERNPPFPSFGSGPVEVRLYSDYFCPPCQKTEPHLEPILKDLMKRKIIRLILVDFPMHEESALYTRYFLYSLNSRNDADYGLRVRRVLFNAATGNDILTAKKIEELFRKNKIPYTVFDPKPVFERFKALIKEDHINSTPRCVIIKAGKKETLVGGMDIYTALKALQ
ncbi:MAG: thioredoxin domain-containing protein [Deltaproteobacteria bacterium]|nr:thioredoxin domain-containing protein [Deltaproteobacteria bacterium]